MIKCNPLYSKQGWEHWLYFLTESTILQLYVCKIIYKYMHGYCFIVVMLTNHTTSINLSSVVKIKIKHPYLVPPF